MALIADITEFLPQMPPPPPLGSHHFAGSGSEQESPRWLDRAVEKYTAMDIHRYLESLPVHAFLGKLRHLSMEETTGKRVESLIPSKPLPKALI